MRFLSPAATAAMMFVGFAPGQVCEPDWSGFPVNEAANVRAMAMFDDGSGPRLYVGGGSDQAPVWRWAGDTWEAIPSPFSGEVYAMTAFDDGGGSALYVGVDLRPVAAVYRWDGTAWGQVGGEIRGTPAWTRALVGFDDGSGPSLFLGGAFDSIGESAAAGVARWDGARWHAVGLGIAGDDDPFYLGVYSLCAHDPDGDGPITPGLFAGGSFDAVDGSPANNIARWSGSRWLPLDHGRGFVMAMTSFDGIGGPALYAAGHSASCSRSSGYCDTVSRWDGSSWITIGGSLRSSTAGSVVQCMAAFDASLWIGGRFITHDDQSARHLARWTGTGWESMDDGADEIVRALSPLQIGDNPYLVAGGEFTAVYDAGGVETLSRSVAAWNGSLWKRLATGFDRAVESLITFDDGGTATVYALGAFATPDGRGTSLARWDDGRWHPLTARRGALLADPVVFDDGSGPALYAVAYPGTYSDDPFFGVVRWRDDHWSPYAPVGEHLAVGPLAVFDDGGGNRLYCAASGINGTDDPGVVRWDGSAWEVIGAFDTEFGSAKRINDLAVHEERAGARLFAAGQFQTVDGVRASQIARWDGRQWSALGDGIDGSWSDGAGPVIWDLASFEATPGDLLYVGGSFETAGGQAADDLAAWDGSNWLPIPHGTDLFGVHAIGIADDGRGEALFVSCRTSTEPPAFALCRWDGVRFSCAEPGAVGPFVRSIVGFDDGHGPAAWVAGSFEWVGKLESRAVARWGCTRACSADCDLSGDVSVPDFLCFQRSFADRSPYADFNLDGRFDIFDFLAFQTAFGDGC